MLRLSLASPARQRALVLLLTLATLLPFLGKAFTIDDPVYIWQAQHIAQHPLDPYGALVNWYGGAQPLSEFDKNPPLAAYYLALAGTLLGWSEVALHAASLLPALICALGAYELARRTTKDALFATCAAVLTPAFLVSATNVMCETWMLAFWLLAVVAWLEGFERGRLAWLFVAGLCVALATLSKYPAVVLVPLFFAHGFARERRFGTWTLALVLPVAILAAYDVLTRGMYGQGLFASAVLYARTEREAAAQGGAAQVAVGLVFAGGSLLHAIFCAPILFRWTLAAASVVLVALLAPGLDLSLYVTKTAGLAPNVPLAVRVQFVVFLLGGVAVLALALADLWKRRTPDAWLLALWVVGVFAFASVVNWTTNARSLLPIAPALACLIVRRLEGRGIGRARWLALAPGAVLAIAVAAADAAWANQVRGAAQLLVQRTASEPGKVYGGAHWGFQYYVEQCGIPTFDVRRDRAETGDRLLYMKNNTNLAWPPGASLAVIEELESEGPRLVHTVAPSIGAGFYASELGPLPFVIGRAEPDLYYVVRAKANAR
ncbi:MAG: ArnT family glycosyltransferase [Planctomycetota bacterium]